MRNLTHCLMLALLACTSGSVFAADADNGLRLAERWCASCHVVSSAQSTGNDRVPPFSAIADGGLQRRKAGLFPAQPAPHDAEHVSDAQ